MAIGLKKCVETQRRILLSIIATREHVIDVCEGGDPAPRGMLASSLAQWDELRESLNAERDVLDEEGPAVGGRRPGILSDYEFVIQCVDDEVKLIGKFIIALGKIGPENAPAVGGQLVAIGALAEKASKRATLALDALKRKP